MEPAGRHMFDTLDMCATATEMGARGEFNVGQFCREGFGRGPFPLGFGTSGHSR